ncbi:MAG: MFS transporter [Tepidisphaeraceae bacterium]
MSADAASDQQAPTDCAPNAKRHPSQKTLRGLDWLNFFLADVQTGVGPFLAIYLAGEKWDSKGIGIALTVGGIAGILTQTPAGGLVDRLRAKRSLIVAGVLALAIGALVIAFFPYYWPVMAAQVLIGGTSSVLLPAVVAISLGLVGHKLFDRRQGRNQTFNSAGNVAAAVAMGAIGYYLSNRGIFFYVVAMVIPTILCVSLIDPKEIDHDLARGCKPGQTSGNRSDKPGRVIDLLKDRPLLIFVVCCVMFHFANAAMLPLLGELLSKGKGRSSMMFMSACVVTTQLVITLIAGPAGKLASTHGRKTLLLIAFAALPIRGLLYTLTHNTYLLVAIQVLDGIGAGIFGVVSILVIADLTRGTGRFNLAQGSIATAVGIGASLSQGVAGILVHRTSFNVGFLFLAGVATLGLMLLWTLMPETKDHPAAAPSRGEPSALAPVPAT